MKRCTCGAWFDGSKCQDCGKDYQAIVSATGKPDFYGYCWICGHRARNVKGDKEKPEYWCYECWRKEEEKKFHFANRVISPEELAYEDAKRIYILKPQFYGEQPDYDTFQLAADKYTAYQLSALKKQRNKPRN